MIIYYFIIYWKREKICDLAPCCHLSVEVSLLSFGTCTRLLKMHPVRRSPSQWHPPPQRTPLCLGCGVRTFFLAHEFTFSNGDLSADHGSIWMLTPSVRFIPRETSWRPCHLWRWGRNAEARSVPHHGIMSFASDTVIFFIIDICRVNLFRVNSTFGGLPGHRKRRSLLSALMLMWNEGMFPAVIKIMRSYACDLSTLNPRKCVLDTLPRMAKVLTPGLLQGL